MNEASSELKLHAVDYWQVLRNRYGVILLAFFLVFMTAAVITYILPKEYLGKVKIQINREAADYDVFETGSRPGAFYVPPTFVQTQFEIIKSKETLYKVVDDLKLDERWGVTRAQGYGKLLSGLEAEEERGTDLIVIQYFDTDPDLAAEISNSIAKSYEERRRSLEQERANRAVETLSAELNTHKDKVENARLEMLDIAERYGIVDIETLMPNQAGSFEPFTGKSTTVMKSIQDSFDARTQIQQISSQLQALKSLEGENLIRNANQLAIENTVISVLYPQYTQLQLSLRGMLDSGLGTNHPDVAAVRGQIQETYKHLLEAVDDVKDTLQTRLDMAQMALTNAEDVETSEKADAMSEQRKTVEYSEAKKRYEMSKGMLATMEAKVAAESVDLVMPKTPIVVHERAEPSNTPAKPNVPLNLVLGAVVGLGFGVGLAFFLEYLDTSVKTLDDVEKYLGVPVLAVIPRDVGVLHKQSGLTPDAEAYRILRTNIEFNRKSADANSITIISGGAGEGKSTTLVNLAYICAQGGYNTLMIDGDLRRPKLHTFFDINNSVGLTNYLTTELMLEDVILQTPVDNLYFMPSGILPADAAGILNSRRMSELIADVKNRFDLVLIDSPPILGVSDASVLASEVDLTMLVIQHRKLPRSMLVRVKQLVENVGGNLLGVVLNNVDVRSDSQYQYYTSYYTYYSPTSTRTRTRRRDTGEGPASSTAGADAVAVAPGAEPRSVVPEARRAVRGPSPSRPPASTDPDDEY